MLGWFDHLCELQNSARNNRKHMYETEGRFVSRYDQEHLLKVAREKYDDFRQVPQDFQVSVLKRVDKAFDAFRKRCKEGAEKKGYPRYKKRVRSLTWCLRKHKLKTGERVRQNPIKETNFRHNRLKLPKLGEVKIRMHRRLEGDPKEVTLVKKASGWYAHITCELPDTSKVEPTDAIAVDVGTTHYLTTSAGEKEDNPRWYRRAEGLLHKHNQTMARRKKGSNAGKTQVMRLPCTMSEPLTNAKISLENSSTNFFIIAKITSLSLKTSAYLTWFRTNTSARAFLMRLGVNSLSGVRA